MKHLIMIPVFAVLSTGAYGQTAIGGAASGAASQAGADAGAMAQTGAITFEAGEQRKSQRIHTTPHVYAPPSMFGGANNCGASDSMAVSVTGFGIGGSRAKESANCNAREDTAIWAKLGFMNVAQLRFACFGTGDNRAAFEAAGYACPSSATAKGVDGAPVGPKFAVAPAVQDTIHMRINQDGTMTVQ